MNETRFREIESDLVENIRYAEEHPEYDAKIKKRLGKISFSDWLFWTKRFISIYSEVLSGNANLSIERRYEIKGENDGKFMEYHFEIDGKTIIEGEGKVRDVNSYSGLILDIEDIPISLEILRHVQEALTRQKFNKSTGIQLTLKPQNEEYQRESIFGFLDMDHKFKEIKVYSICTKYLEVALIKGMPPKDALSRALYSFKREATQIDYAKKRLEEFRKAGFE